MPPPLFPGRSALHTVGLFDEDFGAFFEDVDWSLRAQLAGLDCRYVPSAVVYHMGSATLGAGLTDYTRYQLWRNTVWMLAKGMPASVALRHAPSAAGRAARSSRRGRARSQAQHLAAGLARCAAWPSAPYSSAAGASRAPAA